MKTKKILSAGLAASMLLGTLSGFTACGHTHELTLVEKKAATCTEAGYEAYYQCSGCEKLFSDEKGETEIATPEELAAGHKIQEVAKKDATCTTEGAAAHYKCTVCNQLFSDAAGKNAITSVTPIPVLAHTIEVVNEKRPTCTEAGYEEHYKCSVCGTLFSDEEGKTKIDAPTAITAEHRLVPTAKKEATCAEAGYEAYYTCSICNKLFSDNAGATEISAPVVIPQTTTHTLGFGYTAENVPAPVAAGGKLNSQCAVCGVDMGEVSYDVGHKEAARSTLSSCLKLGSAGMYYFQLNERNTRSEYFGFHATKAGVYTITITDVYGDENLFRYLDKLWIVKNAYPTSSMSGQLMSNNTWDGADVGEFGTVTAEDVAKYQKKVNIEGYVDGGKDNPVKSRTPLTKITFTFTEEDVADGGLYIVLGLMERVQDGTDACAIPQTPASYLIKFETP